MLRTIPPTKHLNNKAAIIPLVAAPLLLIALATFCCWDTPPNFTIDYITIDLQNATFPRAALGLGANDSAALGPDTFSANLSVSGSPLVAGGFDLKFNPSGNDLMASYANGSGRFSTTNSATGDNYTIVIAFVVTSNNSNVSALKLFGASNSASFKLSNLGEDINLTRDSNWENVTVTMASWNTYDIVLFNSMSIRVHGEEPMT